MAQTENQKKLLKILNEIFQLNQSDLDFGIYRIMNTKSKEINEFLDKDLLSSVALAFSKSENEAEQNELDELKDKDTVLGYINGDESTKKAFENLEDVKRYVFLNEKLSSSSTSSNLENEVFSHLANFFKRYYKDGDFVSLRRYKKNTYAIPYEGEEVKTHWANSDQYYIKSGEYFRDYTFTVDGKTIHLKLSDAETESNNNKPTKDKEKQFVLIEPKEETENTPEIKSYEVINNDLFIYFEYKSIEKDKTKDLFIKKKIKGKDVYKINTDLFSKLFLFAEDTGFNKPLNQLAPTPTDENRTILEKHLKNYTSRNNFDYFIHKDLDEFLGRELDFYIKNEMLFLDDIMLSTTKYAEVKNKINIFKEVSEKIIAFLSQLEELQKKLWEKKKFVIETNYCITLDKIDSKYYNEIFACKKQLTEWKELFGLEVKSIDELKEEKYLVLDTKFFDMKFKYKLLSEFDNLDEEIDGVLINSENFGALNLLQDRYKEQIKTVYIDPPYNTGSDDFLYNDAYQHSSWMSFMYDRLSYAKNLINNNGCLFSSINDNETSNLEYILKTLFSDELYQTKIALKVRHENRILRKDIAYQEVMEDIHFVGKKDFTSGRIFDKNAEDNKLNDYLYNIEITGEPKEIVKIGAYDVEVYDMDNYTLETTSPLAENLKRYTIRGSLITQKGSASEYYELNLRERKEKDGFGTLYKVINMGVKGDGLGYRYIQQPFESGGNNGIYFQGLPIGGGEDKGNPYPNFYDFEKEFNNIGDEGGLKFPNGKKPIKLLELLFKISNIDEQSIILDFFAGSGTTGHAVIEENRKDNGKRKYLLVEMGEYFNTKTKPRIQNVIYADTWKDGKPITKNGISQIFKYFKLESYEDTLNNLEFRKTEEQQKTIDYYPQAKEDYMLNYSLDVESQGSLLNIDTFSTPFDYKLKIATSSVGETKDTTIDLVETFNYLLGLVVNRMEIIKDYLVIEGSNLAKERILVIWRSGQSNKELNDFFETMDWNANDSEFHKIYVNGDNNLSNLRTDENDFKVSLIEDEFKKLMFGK